MIVLCLDNFVELGRGFGVQDWPHLLIRFQLAVAKVDHFIVSVTQHPDQILRVTPYVSVSLAAQFANQALFFSSKARARLQTFSTVNPYSRISTGAGAEAPKWSRPITSPRSPR